MMCVCVCMCVCVNKRDVENVGNNSRKQAMVCKCCVVDCRSNYAGEERTTVLSFPKEESLRKIWIKFVNRKDWEPTPLSFICIKHFKETYYRKGKNDKRYRLTKN